LIDDRAIIDPSASIGENVTVGPWTWIGPNVEIGDGCWIAPHVVLKGPTRIGRNNKIFQFASVGEDTPAIAYHGEPTTLVIGDDNVIREGVTIHRGLVQDLGTTVIGNNCLLMAYVHVGHDCVVGDHVIMANNASISGHVQVGDHANFGGYSGVPQYRKIGAYTHISGMSLVLKDVPAYVTVMGNPASAIGLNIEGMRRRGYSKDVINALKEAHKVVYREGRTIQEACTALEHAARQYPQVATFVESIRDSQWGIVRPRSRGNSAESP
jgi:UDP-N-acetylglucosamine acyltransferase